MKAPHPPQFPSVWSCKQMTPEQLEAEYKRYDDQMREYGQQCADFLGWLYGSTHNRPIDQ